MGLSSSQARMLSLTSRQHDIEYKAQKLEAQKLQMANESTKVYSEYEDALSSTKIQHKTIGADGSTAFVDATYANFVGTNASSGGVYSLRDVNTGAVYLPDNLKRAYDCSNKTVQGFLTSLNDMLSGANSGYTSITSAAQLAALNGQSGQYRLDSDITINSWAGISNFSGTFDGNGHTVTIASGTQGLFNSVSGATIKNVSVVANISSTNSGVGALVGTATNSTISNCSSSGSVTGATNIGGLIGRTSNSGTTTITNCGSSADVYSSNVFPGGIGTNQWCVDTCAGGFIGGCGNSVISDCTATGDVKSEYWTIGGFFGASSTTATITNCSASGTVTGNCNGNGDILTYLGSPRSGTIGAFGGIYTGTITNSNSTSVASLGGSAGYIAAFSPGANGGSATLNGCYASTATSDADLSINSIVATGTKTTPNVLGTNTNASSYPNIPANMLNSYIGIYNGVAAADGKCESVPVGAENSSTWFTNMVDSGNAIISVMNTDTNGSTSYTDTNVATDTNLQEVSNETNLKKAEAKYESAMAKINSKDKKYDTNLASLDTERNAIKTEIDTLKTVSKDNIDRTFKLFG